MVGRDPVREAPVDLREAKPRVDVRDLSRAFDGDAPAAVNSPRASRRAPRSPCRCAGCPEVARDRQGGEGRRVGRVGLR